MKQARERFLRWAPYGTHLDVNIAHATNVMRAITEVRSVARRLGLTPYLGRIRDLVQRAKGDHTYEAGFDRALISCVRPGDVAWDIGANVGLYTTRLSDAVGPSGCVVAFEPVPACFAELVRKSESRSNVIAHRLALSNEARTAQMALKSDPLSTTNSLANVEGANTVEVTVEVARELVASGRVPAPNIVKIDVEGFEEEVIEGFGPILSAQSCRAFLIEVHFRLLDQRGRRQAPARILEVMRGAGFNVRWVDASHLEAVRSQN